MSYQNKISAYKAVLSEYDFQRIKTFVEKKYGIRLPLQKKIMVQGRLHKRLAETDYNDFESYLDYVFSEQGKTGELYNMVDALSTNKSSFFREPHHFEFIQSKVIPEFIRAHSFKTLKAWSAGCSSGEEVYTLAMVLNEGFEKLPRMGYSIYGSDISVQMLKKARQAVYPINYADDIPVYLRKKYILKSKDPSKKLMRVSQQLRSHVLFNRLNFMDPAYQTPYTFDIVMLRNVIIYFDKPTQNEVIRKVVDKMNKGGYLFLGHSETILNNNFPLENIVPTIFRKI